jgi:ribose 5-phosphate isomerase A
MTIDDPVAMEAALESIVGVVTVGLFARRAPEFVLVGRESGVEQLQRVASIERR